MKYLKTTEKVTIPNYPYGYVQKTTAYFSLEHNPKKGFRTVFQTINPKTGKLNKEKKSTYSPVMILKNTDGNITSKSLDFYGDDGIQKGLDFLAEHYELFTQEQIKSIALTLMSIIKSDMMAKIIYTNSPKEKLFPLYKPAFEILKNIANTGNNLFGNIQLDYKTIKSYQEEGFNPFKVIN